jgi:hypothetical protein
MVSRVIARGGYLGGQERRESQNSSRPAKGGIRALAPYIIDGAEACRLCPFGLCAVAGHSP